ncbi:MAG: DUF805 domain-containing protein [Patescibacteria group bacterium]|jgi:uncharacterized membrane protein YhaH (DUF805 family)
MNYYVEVLKKYVVFSGRATRSEYWYFVLFNMIIMIVLSIIDMFIGTYSSTSNFNMGILSGLYSLAVLLPSLAVAIRRLHDTGRTGWWLFISLIPIIGAIVLLVFMVTDSQSGDNKYGPNPKGVAGTTV